MAFIQTMGGQQLPLVTETNEQYHSTDAWSKSRLWRYSTLTPYRAEFGKVAEKDYYLFGTAGHIAVLEPERLESSIFKATATRRGTNEWKANEEEAEGRLLLKAEDYDLVMLCRDVADANPIVRQMREGKIIVETSCYGTDPETGAKVKCRPDHYNVEYQGMLDVKFLADISDDAWSRDIGAYGYAVQDAYYNHVWNLGSGHTSEFMAFACISKTEPPEIIVRELEPVDIQEGVARFKEALALAERCRKEQHWPGQPTGVVRGVKMRDRDRRFTPSQWKVDQALTGEEYE